MPRFTTTMSQFGNNTGIEIPQEIIAALGAGRRPAVAVTVNGFAYRSTVGVMAGRTLVPFSSDKRAATGIAGGDPITVDVELDTLPRGGGGARPPPPPPPPGAPPSPRWRVRRRPRRARVASMRSSPRCATDRRGSARGYPRRVGRSADAIAEGLTIADAAARLAVRNHILVEAIAHDAAFDPAATAVFAREVLRALVAEQENAAAHAVRLGRAAGGRHSLSDGTHDYRDRDRGNLRRRRRQSAAVAKRLRARSDSDDEIAVLVERARQDAWGDVAANLERRLAVEGMRREADPDYETMREARMDALRLIDLQRLAARARHRADHR